MADPAKKLVMMLNQIAAFHRRKPPEDAAIEVAAHLDKFWEPRMRQQIFAHLDAGGAGLSDNARAAVVLLRKNDSGRLPFEPMAAAKLDEPLEA